MGRNGRSGRAYVGGVDIGGTKLHAVITNGEGKVLGRGRKKTKADLGFAAVMDRVVLCLEDACQESGVSMSRLRAVGVAAPAPVLPDGTVVQAPNMGWRNVPLTRALGRRLSVPVFAENDCNAGTLGEYVLGSGKGAKSLVGLFVGTGLGGGIVYRGEVVRGENCMAAEIGHMIVKVGGRDCNCGHRGCLEAYASKAGMGKRLEREIKDRGRRSLLTDETDGDYRNIRSGVLAKAYEEGDEVTRETLHEAADYLGIGIANLITLLGPDRVVIGGGVFEALGRQLLGRVRKSAAAATFPEASFKDTRIVLSGLKDDAVALGALVYAKQRMATRG